MNRVTDIMQNEINLLAKINKELQFQIEKIKDDTKISEYMKIYMKHNNIEWMIYDQAEYDMLLEHIIMFKNYVLEESN